MSRIVELIRPKQANKFDTIVIYIFLLFWSLLFLFMLGSMLYKHNFSFISRQQVIDFLVVLAIGLFFPLYVILSNKIKIVLDRKSGTIIFQGLILSKVVHINDILEWGTKTVPMAHSASDSGSVYSPLLVFKFKNGKKYRYPLGWTWMTKKKAIIFLLEKCIGSKPKNYGKSKKGELFPLRDL